MLRCGRYQLDLERPKVMGIINITPDSFSDGGVHFARDAAIASAWKMVEDGAHLVDLGAESTRPGATPLGEDEEWARLSPVLEGLKDFPLPISVDTYKPQIMQRALESGASMINDVWAFRRPGAIDAVVRQDCALCAMHMQGDPLTMQLQPNYADVVTEVTRFLGERLAAFLDAGIAPERVTLDPGFGFGKTAEQNYKLLGSLDALSGLGAPLLVGVSRKSMLGAATGREANERVAASVAAAILALERGARILRVHDVRETVDALKVWEMMDNSHPDRHRSQFERRAVHP